MGRFSAAQACGLSGAAQFVLQADLLGQLRIAGLSGLQCRLSPVTVGTSVEPGRPPSVRTVWRPLHLLQGLAFDFIEHFSLFD